MESWTTPQIVTLLVSLSLGIVVGGLRMSGYVNRPLGHALIIIGASGIPIVALWVFLDLSPSWILFLGFLAFVLAFATALATDGAASKVWKKFLEKIRTEEDKDLSRSRDALKAFLSDDLEVLSGREVKYEGEKSPLISVTLHELRKKLKGQQTFRQRAFSEPYLNKWMPVEGRLKDISDRYDKWSITLDTGIFSFSLICTMKSGQGVSHAESGDRVRLIGRMATLDYYDCSLKDCELLAEIGRITPPTDPQSPRTDS